MKLYTQSKTLYASSMTVYTVIFMIFIDLWWYKRFLFLRLFIYCWSYLNCCLRIFQFKNWYFSLENRGSSAEKNGVSNSSSSRVNTVVLLTFIPYMKKFIVIRQNIAVPVESAGPLTEVRNKLKWPKTI